MAPRAMVFVLDYCGGRRTDQLVDALTAVNPTHRICVLDNASPRNRSRRVTHRNVENSFTGGGIRDCQRLASRAGSTRLLFVANDLSFLVPPNVDQMEAAMDRDPAIVQISSSVTPRSAQAGAFPWMVHSQEGGLRVCGHADILCTMLDLKFVDAFGGFPASRGGWGFSWEMAYQARQYGRKIAVDDSSIVEHCGVPQTGVRDLVNAIKRSEMVSVYTAKYGSLPWLDIEADLRKRWRRRPAEAVDVG